MLSVELIGNVGMQFKRLLSTPLLQTLWDEKESRANGDFLFVDATISMDHEGIFERRKVLLLSAFGFLVRGFQIAPENGVAVAAEYADSKFFKHTVLVYVILLSSDALVNGCVLILYDMLRVPKNLQK